MKSKLVFALFASNLGLASLANAHSGGTDASGCHHDRSNGTYHCHKSDTQEPTLAKPNEEKQIASSKRSPVSSEYADRKPTSK